LAESGTQQMKTAIENETASQQPGPGGPAPKTLVRKLIPWAAKGGLAIADYGMISGSNFLLGVLLARWLSPEHYGAYALAFSIYVLVAFLYQALLLEPLSVFSGTTYHDNLRGYLITATRLHWLISAVVGLLLGLTGAAAWIFWHSPVLGVAFAGLTIATPFILVHAMARRSFYLRMSPAPAAFASFFYCILVTGGVFAFYSAGWLTVFTAYLLMGLAALVSGIIMLFQLNAKLPHATGHPAFREVWGKHWEYGKWALGTCVVGWIPNYVYIPLVSGFSGIAAAGELRALMNFSAPLLQTFAALSMLFLPYAARSQEKKPNRRDVTALMWRLTILFVIGGAAYWALMIPFRLRLFQLVYAGKYVECSSLIPLFALETMMWSAALGPAILLRAMESPRSLFFANAAASLIAFVMGIPATRYFGLQGVVWSMIIANMVYMIVAFILMFQKLANLHPGAVEFVPPMPADEAGY